MASMVARVAVERETGERIDALSGTPAVEFAQRALGCTDAEIERTRVAVGRELPAKVGRVATAMLDPDCACRARLASALEAGARQRLLSLLGNRAQVTTRMINGLLELVKAGVVVVPR